MRTSPGRACTLAMGAAVAAMLVGTQGAAATPVGGPVHTVDMLTGAYQLYCPATALGDVVIHVTTSATVSPPRPVVGHTFHVDSFQEKITFAQGLAQGLATLSPLSGKAAPLLYVAGGAPSSMQAPSYGYHMTVPKTVPAAGVTFYAPVSPAAPLGPFKASSTQVVVSQSKHQEISLTWKGSTAPFQLNCTSFPNSTADSKPGEPWSGSGEPPLSKAINPVIAVG